MEEVVLDAASQKTTKRGTHPLSLNCTSYL
jgi:hypothetical protein